MRTHVVLLSVLLATVLCADDPKFRGKPVSYWLSQLEQSEPPARLAAVRALRAFGPEVEGVLPGLVKALADASVEVRLEAVSGLAEMGPKAADAIDALGIVLADESPEVRAKAAQAVGKLGKAGLPAYASLLVAIDDADASVQAAVCAAIEALPLSPKARAEAATRAARGKAPGVKAWGLRQLASLGAEAKDAEPLLLEALADGDATVRRRAAEALSRIGASDAAMPPLTRALADADPSVVGAAIDALATFGEKAAPPLLELLQQEEGNMWQLASRAIVRLGPQAGPIVPELAKMLRDRDEAYRKRAATTLAQMGEDGRETLKAAASDKDEHVRQTAVEALAGGARGSVFASRRDAAGEKSGLVARGGGTKATETAVHEALGWLARHQAPDGRWSARDFSKQCGGALCGGEGFEDYDIGLTGLAVLAFLGAGNGLDSRDAADEGLPFGPAVMRGVDWLMAKQQADGGFDTKGSKRMYNDAIATYALAEAYGMTDDHAIGAAAQKAVDALAEAQNPRAAWRYSPRSGENDTSVTGWCVSALEAARGAGLKVDGQVLENAWAWVRRITDANFGKVGYQRLEDAGLKVVVPGKNEEYAHHDTMAAIGMVVRAFVEGNRNDPALEHGAKLLVSDLPSRDEARMTTDYYYWYYGTNALFHYDGPGSGGTQKYWKPWNQAVVLALMKSQYQPGDGCLRGSWDPDDRWGFEGGRIYATALNALTLETYYRYPSAFAK